MRRAKPLSEVWIHFERQKIDNKYMAKCKYCQTEYYTNVPRMWKHLKCANCPGTVKETVKQKQKAGASRPNVPDNDDEDDVEMAPTQPYPYRPPSRTSSVSLASSIAYDQPSTSEPKKAKLESVSGFLDRMQPQEQVKLHKAMAKWIYSAGLPLSCLENPYCKDFFKRLRPVFSLPSR